MSCDCCGTYTGDLPSFVSSNCRYTPAILLRCCDIDRLTPARYRENQGTHSYNRANALESYKSGIGTRLGRRLKREHHEGHTSRPTTAAAMPLHPRAHTQELKGRSDTKLPMGVGVGLSDAGDAGSHLLEVQPPCLEAVHGRCQRSRPRRRFSGDRAACRCPWPSHARHRRPRQPPRAQT